MTRRKTVNLDIMIRRTNAYLAAPSSTPDGREALCAHLESILFDAGRYDGFRYLETDEVFGAGTRRHYFGAD